VSRTRNLGVVATGAPDPDRVALIDLADPAAPREWSFGALDRMSAGVAGGLLARGGKRGDRVAILSANRGEYLAVFLGAMRAGLVAVPVNVKLPPAAIEHILGDAAVSVVFVDHERRAVIAGNLPVVEFGKTFDAFLAPGDFASVEPEADEIAQILYTSGSTGRPKGVPLTHGGQMWASEYRLRREPDLDRRRLLVAAPLYHMNALWVTTTLALPGRASVVMLPRFSALAYIEAALTRSMSAWVSGAEPMVTARTDDRSVRASAAVSWTTSAIMVGTAVSHVQR